MFGNPLHEIPTAGFTFTVTVSLMQMTSHRLSGPERVVRVVGKCCDDFVPA